MTAEALRLGWSIERVEATLKPQAVEPWQAGLERQVFPKAIFIFVESAGFQEQSWKGRYWWLKNPEFQFPQTNEGVPLQIERIFPQSGLGAK